MFKERCFGFLLIVLCVFAVGGAAAKETNASSARTRENVVVPVSTEIFRILDKFSDANWKAVQRPEVIGWKSQGDQVQIATLLGVVTAEGFIAIEAKDAQELKEVGHAVLQLARGLGVEEKALRHSRSIIDHADQNEWEATRAEWDAVLAELEDGLVKLRSKHLSELVSAGGWFRGTEALATLVLQNYSAEKSGLLVQPGIAQRLEKQLKEMNDEGRRHPLTMRMLEAVREISAKTQQAPVSTVSAREVRTICDQTIRFSSSRASGLVR